MQEKTHTMLRVFFFFSADLVSSFQSPVFTHGSKKVPKNAHLTRKSVLVFGFFCALSLSELTVHGVPGTDPQADQSFPRGLTAAGGADAPWMIAHLICALLLLAHFPPLSLQKGNKNAKERNVQILLGKYPTNLKTKKCKNVQKKSRRCFQL